MTRPGDLPFGELPFLAMPFKKEKRCKVCGCLLFWGQATRGPRGIVDAQGWPHPEAKERGRRVPA